MSFLCPVMTAIIKPLRVALSRRFATHLHAMSLQLVESPVRWDGLNPFELPDRLQKSAIPKTAHGARRSLRWWDSSFEVVLPRIPPKAASLVAAQAGCLAFIDQALNILPRATCRTPNALSDPPTQESGKRRPPPLPCFTSAPGKSRLLHSVYPLPKRRTNAFFGGGGAKSVDCL